MSKHRFLIVLSGYALAVACTGESSNVVGSGGARSGGKGGAAGGAGRTSSGGTTIGHAGQGDAGAGGTDLETGGTAGRETGGAGKGGTAGRAGAPGTGGASGGAGGASAGVAGTTSGAGGAGGSSGSATAEGGAGGAVDEDVCSPNPCLNGSNCVYTANSFACNCAGTGYVGLTCATDVDECAENDDDCGENATCTNTPGSFICSCSDGYEGDGITCTATAPSCSRANGTECQGESCCTTLAIPTQNFTLGLTEGQETSAATITGFSLDKFEVTVGRFRRFLTAYDAWRGAGHPMTGAGAHPLIANSGWQSSWTLAASASELSTNVACGSYQTLPDDNAALPMNCLNWYEAFAFCAWDGQRLPTEAEWEDAATGGSDQRVYPWGSPVPDRMDATYAVYWCLGDGDDSDCSFSDILSVGSKPDGAGRWGHLDLAGSTWEWVLDSWDYYPTTCADCADVSFDSINLLRGGGWGSNEVHLRVGYRNGAYGWDRGDSTGVRCAH